MVLGTGAKTAQGSTARYDPSRSVNLGFPFRVLMRLRKSGCWVLISSVEPTSCARLGATSAAGMLTKRMLRFTVRFLGFDWLPLLSDRTRRLEGDDEVPEGALRGSVME